MPEVGGIGTISMSHLDPYLTLRYCAKSAEILVLAKSSSPWSASRDGFELSATVEPYP